MLDGSGFWSWAKEFTDDLLNWKTLVALIVIAGLALGWFQWEDIAAFFRDIAHTFAPHFGGN